MNSIPDKDAKSINHSMIIPWWRHILITVSGLIITGILFYGFYTGNRMAAMYAPLIDAAMEIKLEATTAHLWFEEILSGDRHESMNKVWKHLEQTDWYMQAMLHGGKNQEGNFQRLEDPELRQRIEKLQEILVEFKDITNQRLVAKETAAAGTAIDQRYDTMFNDFIVKADQVEIRLQKVMSQDLRNFRYVQIALIACCILLLLVVGIAFTRYDRLRAQDFLSLQKLNLNLEKEISDRIEVERALRESEARYKAMFENIDNGVAVYESVLNGDDFILKGFNKAAERIENTERESLIGRSVLDVFPGVKDFGIFDVLQRVFTTGKPEFFPASFYKDDKIAGWRENYVYKLPSGEIVAVYSDQTERMQAREERERLIAELETKNEELERFTYTVSHDLKSPLITIRGFLGYLEKDAERGNRKRMLADMSRISAATKKMQDLLDELLELSRIGRMDNTYEEMVFSDLAQDAMNMVSGRLDRSNVNVIITSDVSTIYGDPPRLREIMENLVDNAVKFLGDQPEPSIEIGTKKDDSKTVFYVRDNGPGIEPQYQEKIFGLFDQLNQEIEGTGVGLAIVKRIIEVHKGQIWVESEGPGKGSTFCFTLPDKSKATEKGV